eukprot:CAMPEP_0197646780 /NCGR_PEP_ID=MMETSP1338-20131121/23845_1 /TAXON_ID=43686 ORGANISM="Pelagodinium beii, Strain RCC1491" /NCGR_SAMPLE_ID=MMETSP1338 /ASSEMBLY_ACC=CAM_ASM_000754 /LENGTH=254 /DNA_ID=CAMNT_0043220441 /DNA_START=57 /DNA_END=821 /DNA_ORIENTATION=+
MEPMYVAVDAKSRLGFTLAPMYITQEQDGRVQVSMSTLDMPALKISQGLPKLASNSELDELSDSGTSLRRASSFDSSASTATSGPRTDRNQGKQAAALLWCEGKSANRAADIRSMAASSGCVETSHYSSPANFTRWLFQACTGTVKGPGAVLVVGWREAKPCGAAIRSVLTGDDEGLRLDGKRPQLPTGGSQICPVKAIIVVAETSKHTQRAKDWIQTELVLSSRLQLRVIGNFEKDLSETLLELASDISDSRA